MTHARAAIAGVLSSGLVILIVTQDADREMLTATTLLLAVVALMLVPEAATWLRDRHKRS